VENKDEISEDLLVDFKSTEENDKFKKAEQLGKKKISSSKEEEKKVIDARTNVLTKDDLYSGAYRNKKKFVDI
jgi:hypothetical protein